MATTIFHVITGFVITCLGSGAAKRMLKRFPGAFAQLKYWRARLRRMLLTETTFIAVTGSCGKTLTTELTAAVLSVRGESCSQSGPNILRDSIHTLLTVAASSRFCVKEVSGDPPDEVSGHYRVLRPNIVIVTTIGSDHYKTFRGPEMAAKVKGQLVENLPPHAVAILNADDPHVRAMADRTRARVVTFGLSPDADIRATESSSVWPDRLALTVTRGHETVHVHTKLVGEHWTTSVLAAIACGTTCGLDLRTSAKVVETFRPLFGRYSVHAMPDGPVYVLDSYKAPSWTIANSLSFLAHAQAPRKTAVFGTISDYPGSAGSRYRRIAREALEVADRVVFVGPQAGLVSKLRQGEARKRLFVFHSVYEASAFLAGESRPEELIYIKGSRTDHLERIMLSQLDHVVCWRERCGKCKECNACKHYRTPSAPPFGLAEITPPIAASSVEQPAPSSCIT